jgi:hypothetical protein
MGFFFIISFIGIYWNLQNVHYERMKSRKHMLIFFFVALLNLVFQSFIYVSWGTNDLDWIEFYKGPPHVITLFLFTYIFNVPQLMIAACVVLGKDSRDLI